MKALIRWSLRFIPRPWLQRAVPAIFPILAVWYRGKRYECPICQSRWRKMLPYGRVQMRANALCPKCQSLERHRLIWLYLQRKTDFFSAPHKVLHIAPEVCFVERFKQLPQLKYYTADLESPWADIKMDIRRMPLEDNSFDIIFCNHVLEHIDDEQQALRELYRVLRPGGWALLQVPINYELEHTFEDPSIESPEAREKYYGQNDHVRQYGRDYAQRLEKAGFRVKADAFVKTLPPDEVRRFALPANEILYIAVKP
ncbi:SAM-dependent methyltransferase [Thermonema lapsum]|uniref:SAM-dependent methyltransferase n=1 Tax=Thermonema lapsum TaxID=28195 RepID=A0A846MNG1_9BACT|nr:class I SAM-dependent methyltransferase [Thermonema lapsum]NIK72950.1 SAM-dependent methyltransferase [Thermonema lapsum]